MMSRGTRERHHRAPAAALATGRMARLRRLLALLAVAATPATAPTPNPVASRRWRARRTSTASGCSYTQIGEMCSGTMLCSTASGNRALPVCEKVYTSGDLEYDHPCKASGSWDVACIQQLCDSSALCGGYQTETDGSSYWLYSTDLAATGNNLYQCWEKFCPGVFFDKTTLEAAVADVTQAEATHGPLAGWDVSRIDDMEMLFRSTNVQNFNGDVSKWDTARVTTFKRTVSGPPRRRQPVARRATRPPSPRGPPPLTHPPRLSGRKRGASTPTSQSGIPRAPRTS